ncbi:MAG: hypothetical protein VR65_02980 [Desulfobulbaceae bacterium BRH_c16a]|nr:MAG: hypothetical protein VR65_02980 [Desulfobulbaceae bacterium BRH_c16a]
MEFPVVILAEGRKTRMIISGFRREVGTGVERLFVRQEKDRHRPSSASGHGLGGNHIYPVDVGTFFSIHFDGDMSLLGFAITCSLVACG